VKTTIELPDDLFREAKATAARRGTSLKAYLQEALTEKLALDVQPHQREGWPVPPMPLSPEESRLFDEAVEQAFEQVEPDDDDPT
jgi:hypothetical protein